MLRAVLRMVLRDGRWVVVHVVVVAGIGGHLAHVSGLEFGRWREGWSGGSGEQGALVMMLGNGVRTQILSGQRITVTWPRAVRDHACGGAALVAIMSHASSDNPSAHTRRNFPPMLTCLLRRPSSSQWESSSPAISQRFSRSMRSRGVSPLFPSSTCFLHVLVSPASSTWCLQIAPHPIISPDALAISASCHSPTPQGFPL